MTKLTKVAIAVLLVASLAVTAAMAQGVGPNCPAGRGQGQGPGQAWGWGHGPGYGQGARDGSGGCGYGYGRGQGGGFAYGFGRGAGQGQDFGWMRRVEGLGDEALAGRIADLHKQIREKQWALRAALAAGDDGAALQSEIADLRAELHEANETAGLCNGTGPHAWGMQGSGGGAGRRGGGAGQCPFYPGGGRNR
jgi:hypothetical protein